MHASGTYNHNLHHSMPVTLEALGIALKLAEDVGTDRDISVIKCAINAINHCEIMWTDDAYASMKKTYEDCKMYGAD